MAGPEIVLTVIAVLVWSRLLGAWGAPRSLFRLMAESVAAHAVVSTLLSVALVLVGAFRPAVAASFAAVLPLGLVLWSRSRGPRPAVTPLITRNEVIVLLVLVAVAPVALPRMETLRVTDDADVYSNRAIHHLSQGSTVGVIPVRDRLEGGLLTAFDRDNLYHPTSTSGGHYLPGTHLTRRSEFVFLGYPGWPMLMAQWGGLFGLPSLFHSVLFAFAMAVVFFGFVLQAAGLRAVTLTAAVALLASSPLLLFFSKYPTTEAFLLFLFLFVIYFLGEGGVGRTALAAAGFLTIVVTHITTLLYTPLVVLVALEAYRSANRKLASFSVAAFASLLAGLAVGLLSSPFYMERIYRGIFRRLGIAEPLSVGVPLIVVLYVAGLVLSVVALRRALTTPDAPIEGWLSSGRRLLVPAIRGTLLLLAAWIVYRGYQLGWTDHFAAHASADGAWVERKSYSGGGWSSLAHLSVVSMAMATSLVGLPVVAGLAFGQGSRVCSTGRRCWLLAAVLLAMALYTFVLVDTPFNYYASRYFIPVLVPATMLLFGELVDAFGLRPVGIAALAAIGLLFNLRSDAVLYRHPARDTEMDFVEEVAHRTGRSRVLFVRNAQRNDPELLLQLGLPLTNAWDISLVNAVGTPEVPVDRLIARYARQLGLRDAAILSKRPPGGDQAFESVVFVRRRLKRHILYPRDGQEWRQRYYLFNVAFPPRD